MNAMVQLSPETATEFDFVIGLDASGSMASPSTRYPGKTRWQEAQETIFGLASILGQYDSDGIDIVVFGGSVEVFEGVTADKVSDIFAKRSPRGSTPLAQAIHEIDRLNGDGKKAVALIFTDGEPDDRAAAEAAIVAASNKLEKDEDFTILFVQIGDDAGAAKFLAHLDDGLTSAKFDIVDTISAAEADKMEPIDLIVKAIND
ncbi:VWA domain-containing protein [Rhizorhabdus sp.]|uniref:VWA domain-containing protein n=1 Tax=Rhizorhabdus sp. TaxID=1968843 RepID=UPI00198B5CA0|nr:VWA domain-containing protein [Rhizorhabdus sp.]MBD3762605.1 VWA domain-containing protein [Rhizorhabdus sp.]